MTAQAIAPRATRLGEVKATINWESVAAITTGTSKARRYIPYYCRILDVIVNSGTAGSGGTSDIIDINIGGTTIFTTQGNRPTLLVGDTGSFSVSGLGVTTWIPEVVTMVPGDILTYDIDQICTTGSALFTITILLGAR